MLPNFLIIGAAKSGTTSLYHYLQQHPDVYMSPIKEPQYYCDEGERAVPALDAYQRLFDGVTSQTAVGEASPQYLNSPSAPRRIADDIPDAKLIVSLRNPADRAYSYYLGRIRGGHERAGVADAMRPGAFYFQTSLYHPGLSRYFERFDTSRIKVILFDDLSADAAAVVRELYTFLGVDQSFGTDVSVRHNVGSMPRSIGLNKTLLAARRAVRTLVPRTFGGTGLAARAQQPLLRPAEPLPSSIRRQLLDRFSDDIAKTSALIGRDLSHWLA
jgi:hypothetical protein